MKKKHNMNIFNTSLEEIKKQEQKEAIKRLYPENFNRNY